MEARRPCGLGALSLAVLGLLACGGEKTISAGGAPADGAFRAAYDDGTPKAEGAFQDGKQTGTWTQWYEDGTKGSEGAFSAGEKTGPWTYWHRNGAVLAQGRYLIERTGPWTFRHDNGALQAQGSFLFGQKEGLWVHRNQDGTIDPELTGVYEADVRVAEVMIDGSTTEWFDDDQPRFRTEYAGGVRHGATAAWYADGAKRYEGRYEYGRKSGRWTYWEPDGSVDHARSGVYDGWRKREER